MSKNTRETYNWYAFNKIDDGRYFGIVTILYDGEDYIKTIQSLKFPKDIDTSKKFLVDKVFLCGLGKERFEELDLDENKEILYTLGKTANPSKKTIGDADAILRQYPEELRNSPYTSEDLNYFYSDIYNG